MNKCSRKILDNLLWKGNKSGWNFCRFLSIPRKEGWESVIGLEIHAQIQADSKLFSPAGNVYGAPVNTQVALFDAAIPGTLPMINRKCIEAGVLTALALSCEINPISEFDRKHYFYADLPAGYQITQQRRAIANNGELEFVVYSPGVHKKPYYRKSKIRQLQLEQDSGKSLHDDAEQRSLIDLNRAGIALMEIVFDPDLKDGEEAGALVKELVLILQYLQTCNCKMEEGSLRVDANISVNKIGDELGTRTEVKNISSIRALVNAIEYEVQRQIHLLESGGTVVNETRSYESQWKKTVSMRDKEVLQDYRFMPEPNLPPLRLIDEPDKECKNAINISEVRKKMTELPNAKRKRLIDLYKLRLEEAIVVVNTPGCLDYFNEVMSVTPPENVKKASNFIINELLALVNDANLTLHECPVKPGDISKIVGLLDSEKVNYDKAKALLTLLFNGDTRSPDKIVEDEDWLQISNESEIEAICLKVINDNPKNANSYRTKTDKRVKYLKKLLGAVKSDTNGKCNMSKAYHIMQRLLESSRN